MFKKIQYVYLLKKYIKWGVWRVAVCASYIQDTRFLKVNVYRVSFLGVRRPRHGVDHPLPSTAAVKGRVELYLCALLCLHSLFGGELYLFTCSKAQCHIPQDVSYHQPRVWEPKISHFRKCLSANRLIKITLGSTIPLLKNIDLKQQFIDHNLLFLLI